jgi:alkaline phosphatase
MRRPSFCSTAHASRETVPVSDCAATQGHHVETIFEMAERAGRATGIVTTARVTHATPAATYAHVPNRDWEDDVSMADSDGTPGGACKDIADQLVSWPAGDGFEIALGGGRRYFLPDSVRDPEDEGKTGHRADGRNLVEEWTKKSNNHLFVWNTEGFEAVDWASGPRVLGLFDMSHMEYESDRAKDVGGEPSLAELTEVAIDRLKQDENGFVLLVEGGRIDHAHHEGNAARALEDYVAFDAAIRKALELTDRNDTLIVATADHSHTFIISGYPIRGNSLLGLVVDVEGDVSKAADASPIRRSPTPTVRVVSSRKTLRTTRRPRPPARGPIYRTWTRRVSISSSNPWCRSPPRRMAAKMLPSSRGARTPMPSTARWSRTSSTT